MSLLKWKEQAKRKTDLGKSINLVRETLKEKKIADELGQSTYEKMFRPITKRLDPPKPPEKKKPPEEDLYAGLEDFLEDDFAEDIFNVFDERDAKDAKDDRGLYEMDPEDEEDDIGLYYGLLPEGAKNEDDDEFFSLAPEGPPVPRQSEKQIPFIPQPPPRQSPPPSGPSRRPPPRQSPPPSGPSRRPPPPSYSEEGAVGGVQAASKPPPPKYKTAKFMKRKEQEALEEEEILENLDLPLPGEFDDQETLNKYNRKIWDLGIQKRRLGFEAEKARTISEKLEIDRKRRYVEKQSRILTRVRDQMKKGMGIRRRNGRGLGHLLKKLEVIIGEIQAGNNSREMKKMGRAILEILVSQGVPLDVSKIKKML